MKVTFTVVVFYITFFLSNVSLAGGIGAIVSQQVANQISRSTSNAISKNLADRLIIPTLKVENESGEVVDISVSKDSKLLCVLHDDDSVRVWDLDKGVQRPVIKSQGQDFQKVLAVSKGNLIVTGGENGEVTIYEVLTGQLKKSILSNNGDVTALSSSSDESKLIVAYENGAIIIWDLFTFIALSEVKTPHDDDIKFVLFEQKDQNFVVAGEGGFIERWDINKAKRIEAFTKEIDDVMGVWIEAITGQILFIDKDGVLQQFGLLNNVLGTDFVEETLSVDVNQALSVIAVSTEDKKIKVFNTDNIKLLSVIPLNEELYHLKFINQGKQLIASDDKGILHVIDVASAKEIVQLISTETGWTIVDNKGRFDSSEKGMKNVSWEADDDELPLNSFSSTHYEPGLLASHLEDQKFINKSPVVIQKGIKLPPEVTLNVPDGDRVAFVPLVVNVGVQGLGGGVGEIKFYHNGKIVLPSSAFNQQQQTSDKLVKKTVEFKLFPTIGGNTFKVVAVNDMGIEGYSDEVSIDFEGAKQKSTLHVLTIGINKYKDAELNLDYSVADAVAISNIFKTSSKTIYDEMKFHQLYDNDATKKNILQQLNEISEYAQNDILVLYVAGHGLAVDGDWYFLPHETTRKSNVNDYTEVGVSAKAFQKILLNSKIQRVIIMVDACYSGAGLKEFRKLQDTQRHFSRKLSKSVGVVVLAATRRDQEAVELSDLGHGLFTYVVSEGLIGKADLKPKNFEVSAHEISDFSTETIPAFSKKYMGASQEPTSFTMGSDFVLLPNK